MNDEVVFEEDWEEAKYHHVFSNPDFELGAAIVMVSTDVPLEDVSPWEGFTHVITFDHVPTPEERLACGLDEEDVLPEEEDLDKIRAWVDSIGD